nr:RecName: Full=Peroxidase 3 [Cycas revoluta]
MGQLNVLTGSKGEIR